MLPWLICGFITIIILAVMHNRHEEFETLKPTIGVSVGCLVAGPIALFIILCLFGYVVIKELKNDEDEGEK